MKIIILSQDTVISDVLFRKGEVVRVYDSFDENVKVVIVSSVDEENRQKANRVNVNKLKNREKQDAAK